MCRHVLRLAVFAVLALFTPSARAVIVDRIVAVVGERPILWSELQERARPFDKRIAANVVDPATLAASRSQMLRELLKRMIDEQLEEQAAARAHLGVTLDELDGAMRQVAAA